MNIIVVFVVILVVTVVYSFSSCSKERDICKVLNYFCFLTVLLWKIKFEQNSWTKRLVKTYINNFKQTFLIEMYINILYQYCVEMLKLYLFLEWVPLSPWTVMCVYQTYNKANLLFISLFMKTVTEENPPKESFITTLRKQTYWKQQLLSSRISGLPIRANTCNYWILFYLWIITGKIVKSDKVFKISRN